MNKINHILGAIRSALAIAKEIERISNAKQRSPPQAKPAPARLPKAPTRAKRTVERVRCKHCGQVAARICPTCREALCRTCDCAACRIGADLIRNEPWDGRERNNPTVGMRQK